MEKFEIMDGVLVSYNAKDENVIIPDSVKEIKKHVFSSNQYIKTVTIPEGVTKLDEEAFSYCENLKKVIFPKSLESIGKACFSYCEKLSDVTLPKNLKVLDTNAFFSTNITEITLPASVEKIGSSVFSGSTPIKNIFVNEKNIFYKDIDGVLFTIDGKVLISFPRAKECDEYYVPEGVKELSFGSFSSNNTSKVVRVNEGVEKIGQMAFAACIGMGDIYLPSSIKEMDEDIFMGYAVTSGSTIHVKKDSYALKYCEKDNNKSYKIEIEE